MRLDIFLSTHHGLSRNRAKQLIEAGLISIDNHPCTKVSQEITDKNFIMIADDKRVHWVSRSAMKLNGFLQNHREITIQGTHCLDVGSSTGGFTEVLLEHGAISIDAVDVGSNQLHKKIKSDSRVRSYEQTDIRDFPQKTPYNVIVCDASFISISQIFDAILCHAGKATEIMLLFKPQFEVGREYLRKTGVPKDEKCIIEAMRKFEDLIGEKECILIGKEESCLVGEAGNKEWIYWIRKYI